MKQKIASFFSLLAACLISSCATDPITGKRTVSPATWAAIDRVSASALASAEALAIAQIEKALKVHTSGK